MKRGCTTMRSSDERSSTTSFARRQARTIVIRRVRRAQLVRVDLAKHVRPVNRDAFDRPAGDLAVEIARDRFGLRKLGHGDEALAIRCRAELATGESHGFGALRTAAARLGKAVGDRGDGEHSSARGDELTGWRARGAGVEQLRFVRHPARRMGSPFRGASG